MSAIFQNTQLLEIQSELRDCQNKRDLLASSIGKFLLIGATAIATAPLAYAITTYASEALSSYLYAGAVGASAFGALQWRKSAIEDLDKRIESLQSALIHSTRGSKPHRPSS